eukprot:jgi/Psemu1/30408/gm1.30408_g
MEAATNSATWHLYKPERRKQLMPSPKPIKTPVFQAAQLHGTRFKCEDEDKRVTRVSQLDVFQHSDSSLGTNDNDNGKNNNNNNDTRGGEDPLAVHKETVPLPTIQSMVKRSNKLNKGHVCLKWHSATKAQSAQELVKRINPGYPTPEKLGEADLLNTLDWLVAPYQDDKHFKQDWFMGIYMQLMMNHCPEWVDGEPTKDMEASAAGPDIQLAQSWDNPSTINSKATWDSQSHEHPQFAKSQEESPRPPKDLEKIFFQQSDGKMMQELSTWADAKTQESSNNTSWNSPSFEANGTSPPSSPATATIDQLRSVEGL